MKLAQLKELARAKHGGNASVNAKKHGYPNKKKTWDWVLSQEVADPYQALKIPNRFKAG